MPDLGLIFIATVVLFMLGSWIEMFLWFRMNASIYKLLGFWSVPIERMRVPNLRHDMLAGFEGKGENFAYRYDVRHDVLLLRRGIAVGVKRSRRGATACVLSPVASDDGIEFRIKMAFFPLLPILSVPVVGFLIGLMPYLDSGDPSAFFFTLITFFMGAFALIGNFMITRKHTTELLEKLQLLLQARADGL